MRRALLGALAFVLAAIAFLGLQLACSTRVLSFDASDYAPEQFSTAVYAIPETDFDRYDWALYAPGEFAAADAEGVTLPQGEPPAGWADEEVAGSVSEYYGTVFARCRTDCLTLRLVPGGRYGIHVENATYAMRLWVDRELLAENGAVSNAADGFVPQTRSNTVFFTAPEDGNARIVLQRANFCHRYWNTAVIKLGAADLVQGMTGRQLLGIASTLATLFALAIVNLSMGLLSRERSAFLLLAAACLLMAVKGSLDDPKPLMLILPNLDWQLGHRVEHCAYLLAGCSLVLFWWRSLAPLVPRGMATATVALAALGVASYWVAPSMVYSAYTGVVVRAALAWLVAFCAVALWRALRRGPEMGPFRWATLLGMFAFAGFEVADALGYGSLETVSVSDAGVVCVALLNTVALAMGWRKAADDLDAARSREEELARMNESLAALGRVRETYLQNLVHELKTPLSVIAGYSGLTRMQLERGAVNADTAEHLRVAEREAARLGRMVDGAGRVGLGQTAGGLSMRDEDAGALLADAAAFCEPVCQRRGNRVEASCESGLSIRCDRDLVLQVLYNLVVNASRHCEGRAIEMTARTAGDRVEVSVADRGDGMPEEALAHAFDRGWSGDGGTGYGLAICREVAEMHGGTIRAESRAGGGTVVAMALPRPDENAAGGAR